jgi:hypothetical protein
MAQHSNYAQDRDLMMEAYGSVRGIVPRTSSTAMPRGYVLNEGHCSDEETTESVELGGKLYEVGNDDPNDDGLVIKIEKHPNGYFITGGVYSEPEDFVNDPENPREGYGYAIDLEGQPMDEDDLEDGLGHEDAEGHHSSGSDDGECDECGGDGCDVCNGSGQVEDAETAAGGEFDHSVVFQLEGPLSMGVTPLARDVNQAEAGLADRNETQEANGMTLVSDEDGKCILFYNGEELDQGGLEAAVGVFHAEDAEGRGFNANKSDLDDDGNISKYERSRGEAIAAAMKKEDGE